MLAIDASPLGIRVCRKRGVKHAKVLSVTELSRKLGTFDTILMFGNNFGLMGNPRRARWLLRRFDRMTPDDGIIIAGSGDLNRTTDPTCCAKMARNVKKGRLPGEFRLRPKYRHYISPPVLWLYASKDDMMAILKPTAWQVTNFFDDRQPSGAFVALIEKKNCRTKASSRRPRSRG